MSARALRIGLSSLYRKRDERGIADEYNQYQSEKAPAAGKAGSVAAAMTQPNHPGAAG